MVVADMDREGLIQAISFGNKDDMLQWIADNLRSGFVTEDDIIFKDAPLPIASTFRLRQLYKEIFGKVKNIFFKDYVTNETIIFRPSAFINDQYVATFSSLMEFLEFTDFLIIYRNNSC